MDSVVNCTRCGGFVMPEAFDDSGIATVGWHCLLCGETVDDVILRNRTRPLRTSLLDEERIECQSLDSEEEECLQSVFGETLW